MGYKDCGYTRGGVEHLRHLHRAVLRRIIVETSSHLSALVAPSLNIHSIIWRSSYHFIMHLSALTSIGRRWGVEHLYHAFIVEINCAAAISSSSFLNQRNHNTIYHPTSPSPFVPQFPLRHHHTLPLQPSHPMHIKSPRPPHTPSPLYTLTYTTVVLALLGNVM